MKKLRPCFHGGDAQTCQQCIRRRAHRRKKEKERLLRQRFDIFAEYDYCCVFCGTSENLTLDHIVPVSRGGSGKRSNLQPACRTCNGRKGNRETWSFSRREENSGL